MVKISEKSKTLLLFFSFFFLFLAIRLFNLQNYLYFIYDQGRDMAKLVEILSGDITLIGPTTGLQGLFLGPLWYYVGVPGFLLSQGNPVGHSAWYIFLSALAFPGFWWMSLRLFGSKEDHHNSELSQTFGWLCLILLTILPGSITSSTMIWNPLIAAPLMIATLFCFWKVRQSKKPLLWLGLGFLAIGLALQSELAYAIFFLPIFVPAIPWMMKRFKIIDFIVAGLAVGVTLLPQVVFELRNQFLMTKSLFAALTDTSKVVSWAHQFSYRPMILIDTSVDFFNGPDQNDWYLRMIVLTACTVGVWSVARLTYLQHKAKKATSLNLYLKQLIVLFALVPYPFFLIWRGNHGNFFSYYMTPHFIFLTPVFVLGLEYIVQKLWRRELWGKLTAAIIVTGILLPLTISTVQHWTVSIFTPFNQAGLNAMTTAVQTAYEFQTPADSATLVMTPNIYSVHYDYLFNWYGKNHQLQPPRTVQRENDKQLILVIEQWGPDMADYVKEQRKKITAGWTRKRVILSGTITVEEWVK